MPAPKGYVKIAYPRKCEHCDYTSNNPSMYHYHKKTHEPIPEGTLCDHGCGQSAQFRGTGGVYSCSKVSQHCPAYLQKHSELITKQWKDADERRERTRESFVERLHTKEVRAQQKKTLKEKWGNFTVEEAKDFRHYARRIRARAQRWAKEQGYELGQQTFHVDHKLSIFDAYMAKLPESVVNHPANLQIMEASLNSSKGAKSSLTVEELLDLIKKNVED